MAQKMPGRYVWDEKRNTSRVFKPPPDALPAARNALARWESDESAHAGWIMQGAPRLTEREHVARFGTAYKTQSGRRGKP